MSDEAAASQVPRRRRGARTAAPPPLRIVGATSEPVDPAAEAMVLLHRLRDPEAKNKIARAVILMARAVQPL